MINLRAERIRTRRDANVRNKDTDRAAVSLFSYQFLRFARTVRDQIFIDRIGNRSHANRVREARAKKLAQSCWKGSAARESTSKGNRRMRKWMDDRRGSRFLRIAARIRLCNGCVAANGVRADPSAHTSAIVHSCPHLSYLNYICNAHRNSGRQRDAHPAASRVPRAYLPTRALISPERCSTGA